MFSNDLRLLVEGVNENTNIWKAAITINKYKIPTSWWTRNKEGELVQINIKNKDYHVKLKSKL